ncbi:hypothetical protein EON65_46840, partial [archaeon]
MIGGGRGRGRQNSFNSNPGRGGGVTNPFSQGGGGEYGTASRAPNLSGGTSFNKPSNATVNLNPFAAAGGGGGSGG